MNEVTGFETVEHVIIRLALEGKFKLAIDQEKNLYCDERENLLVVAKFLLDTLLAWDDQK